MAEPKVISHNDKKKKNTNSKSSLHINDQTRVNCEKNKGKTKEEK